MSLIMLRSRKNQQFLSGHPRNRERKIPLSMGFISFPFLFLDWCSYTQVWSSPLSKLFFHTHLQVVSLCSRGYRVKCKWTLTIIASLYEGPDKNPPSFWFPGNGLMMAFPNCFISPHIVLKTSLSDVAPTSCLSD